MPPVAVKPAGPPNPAQTLTIIMAVCAGLLLVALVTKGWASAQEGGDITAGLFGFEGCRRGACQSFPWDQMAKRLNIPDDVGMFRIVGMLAGFAAVGAMGWAAWLLHQRKPQQIPLKPILGVMAAASGTLTFFAFRLAMSDKDVNFGPSWGAFVGIGSLIAGGYCLRTMLPKVIQQLSTGMPAAVAMVAPAGAPMAAGPAVSAPQVYPCPRCQAPLTWVAQYQRYHCARCQQYA